MQDLLFLSQRIPFPPNKGDKIRSFHILQELCRDYRVHLGCFIDDPDDWQHLPMIERMVASCCVLPLSPRRASLRSLRGLATSDPMSLPYYFDRRMADWVAPVLAGRGLAAAYLFSSPMAQYLSAGPKPGRVVMDFVDVDSQKWLHYAAKRPWPWSMLFRREAAKLLAFERKVADFADASIFVSEPERRLFGSLAPEADARLHAIGNGTDFVYFSPDADYPCPFDASHPTLVFTGAMDYWPNIEAIGWFVAEVLPLLRRRRPDIRLVIVGLNPTAEVRALAAVEGVTVTGRVPDVRPYLAHAGAIIAPLLTARGIQNKVLEAMSMARPVIATPQAFEGIAAEPGRHLLIADGAEDFAATTLQALANPRCALMGRQARVQIRRAYGWDAQLAKLSALLHAGPRGDTYIPSVDMGSLRSAN